MDEIEAVLHLVQHLDPLGVAYSLRECLLIQLQALPKTIGARELAIELINNHLPLLGTRDFATLTRKLKVQESALSESVNYQIAQPKTGQRIRQQCVAIRGTRCHGATQRVRLGR